MTQPDTSGRARIGTYVCAERWRRYQKSPAVQTARVNTWNWADPRWRERVGTDPQAILKEALRRAVDIRDKSAAGEPLSSRPVLLVEVLNAAFAALGYEAGNLWSDLE